jgi:hypothetical protein
MVSSVTWTGTALQGGTKVISSSKHIWVVRSASSMAACAGCGWLALQALVRALVLCQATPTPEKPPWAAGLYEDVCESPLNPSATDLCATKRLEKPVSCPAGFNIHVVSALYGRWGPMPCLKTAVEGCGYTGIGTCTSRWPRARSAYPLPCCPHSTG